MIISKLVPDRAMKAVLLFSVLVMVGGGGASFTPLLPSAGPDQPYIQRAVADFSRSRRFVRQDSVFSVSVHDTVFHRPALVSVDERMARWVPGPPVEGVVAVSILGTRDKFLFTAATRAGTQKKLPSRYLEKDGRLYYWWDASYPLTDEAIAVFWKYKLFQDDEGGRLVLPDFTINDAKKGVAYYFCRKDPSTYKRVFTSRGTGYYEPPALNCPQ